MATRQPLTGSFGSLNGGAFAPTSPQSTYTMGSTAKDPVTSAITSGGTVGGRKDPATAATATRMPTRQEQINAILGVARGTAVVGADGTAYTPRTSAFPTNIADEQARSDAVGLGAVGLGRPSTGYVPIDPSTGRPRDYADIPSLVDEAITNGNPVGGRQDPATAGTMTPATVPIIHGYRPPADYPTISRPDQLGPGGAAFAPSAPMESVGEAPAPDMDPYLGQLLIRAPGAGMDPTAYQARFSPVNMGGEQGIFNRQESAWAPTGLVGK